MSRTVQPLQCRYTGPLSVTYWTFGVQSKVTYAPASVAVMLRIFVGTPPPLSSLSQRTVAGTTMLSAPSGVSWISTASWAGTSSLPLSPRSEEHTSELQSRENLVCLLLPE